MTRNFFFGEVMRAQSSLDASFVQHAADQPAITYTDLTARTAQYANLLVEKGVRPGDRVAVQAKKSVESILFYLAVVRAGGVYLPLNLGYTSAEVAYFLGDAGPALTVVDAGAVESMAGVAAEAGAGIATLDRGATGSLADQADGAPTAFDDVERGADDLAAILYTSGTTGRSKGAMLTHNNLVSNALALKDIWRFTADDVLIHALPIFHTHGLFVATNTTLFAGGSMIFLPKFDVDAVISAIPQATSLMGVPTFYTRLLSSGRLSEDLCRNMRLFVSGSAPLLAETHDAFRAATGHAILERYGMTETNMITSNPYDGERRAGTVGFPLPDVSIRIADADKGGPIEPGEIGVVEVKGPNVFSGYWQMPEKTASEFRDDGYFITGDLGRIDEDGYLTIVGRGKDLIISGGLNVYPKEVETEIDQLPEVLESAVIGIAHPDFGEGVVAVVVPAGDGEPDEAAIVSALSGRLAKFKLPKRVFVVDELPRNTMGKVQKKAMRERYAATFS